MRRNTAAREAISRVNETCKDVITEATAKTPAAVRLDEKVRRVHEMRYAVNVSMWALGAALNDIRVTRAWEARGTHANWKQFCDVEIRMSVASADRLIFISQRFTEDQTRAFGIGRLCEIRRAPEQHWPELLKLCEGGASARDIRGRVAAIQLAARKSGETRVVLRRAGGKDTTKATLAAADVREVKRTEREKAQAATKIVIAPQEWSIAFMARKSPGEKAAKPAKRIAQQPHGSIVVEGIGTISISLFEGDDGTICADAKFEPTRRAS